MTIKILHLYHDLMNLYGEIGNIMFLRKSLCDQNFDVIVENKSITDDIDFSEYQLVYIGSGTEHKQKLALSHLVKYKDAIHESCEKGTFFLLTGNSFEMFGKSILSGDGTLYHGLAISNFETTEVNDRRYTGDAIFNFECLERPLVGFVNKCSEIIGIETPLFSVKTGPANNQNESTEGFRYKNIFGTHLIGPVLLKNPEFASYFIKQLGNYLISDFNYKQIRNTYQQQAYEITLSELLKVYEKN